MTHEKNMIDYLDWIEGVFLDRKTTLYKIYKHRTFLKSPLKLGDFVPTNEKGEVMAKPTHDGFNRWTGRPHSIELHKDWVKLTQDYYAALDRVMWKGWEIVEGETKYHLKKPNEGSKSLLAYVNKTHPKAFELLNEILGNKTYEQLITSGIKLERIQKK